MKILLAHNRYKQAGGEDAVVRAERDLLRAKGHEVVEWLEDNDGIIGKAESIRTAITCVYSHQAENGMMRRIREFRPDIVHVHNFFPRLSPSIHIECFNAGVPVVQTLHNYRLLCPGAYLRRDNRICEDCVGRIVPWPSIRHRCYRESRLASAAVANMVAIHNVSGTWERAVARFIALSEFSRSKFIEGGLPARKIIVKPNFIDPDPGEGSGDGGFALFVGRLSEEKGIATMLAAWNRISRGHRLRIIGDGPLASQVASAAASNPMIEWVGARSKAEVSQTMADALVLILPSTWYECFPLVVAEAFSVGLPVIASRIGALEELISDGRTGRHVAPGSVDDLAQCAERVFSNPEEIKAMRKAARNEFTSKYSGEINYRTLEQIYQSVI